MRKLEEIQKEIEELRKKLNLAVEKQNEGRIPDPAVLSLSQKMDELLNEYHSTEKNNNFN